MFWGKIYKVILIILVLLMKKGTGTKTRISITLDEKIVSELNSICKERFMKVSPLVEHFIKKGLKELKGKK